MNPFFEPEMLENLADILAVVAFGVTLVAFVRVRRRAGAPGKASRQAFDMEVRLQAMKQQVEKSFETIMDIIAQERRVLMEMLDKGAVLAPEAPPETLDEKQGLEGLPKATARKNTDTPPSDDPYAEAVRLADLGLSVQEISERLRLSRGEVELALKFNRVDG